jgi:hypothetical protein
MKHFYAHLRANNKILPIQKYNAAHMHIWPEAVLDQMQKGPGQWQQSVPEAVAREISDRCMFGFCKRTDSV